MRELLIFLLVAVAGLGFIGGIAVAGYYTLKSAPAQMPRFLAQVVTTTSGVLATNLGAVLGFSVAGVRNFSAISFVAPTTWLAASGIPPATQLQIAAAYFYVFGLIAALVLWGLSRFSEDPEKVVPIIADLSRTLIGVSVGALAVAIGTVPQ